MDSVTGTELLVQGTTKPHLLNPDAFQSKKKEGSCTADAKRDESQICSKFSFTLAQPGKCSN